MRAIRARRTTLLSGISIVCFPDDSLLSSSLTVWSVARPAAAMSPAVAGTTLSQHRHPTSYCDVASRRRNNVEPTSSPDVGLASYCDVASRRRNNVGPTSSPDGDLPSSGDVGSCCWNNVGPTSPPDGDVAAPMPTFANVGPT